MTTRISPMAASISKLPSSLLSNSSTESTCVLIDVRKMAAESSRVPGMNTRMKAPARLRLSNGATTRRMAVKRVPPRMRTASSNSGLMLRIAALQFA